MTHKDMFISLKMCREQNVLKQYTETKKVLCLLCMKQPPRLPGVVEITLPKQPYLTTEHFLLRYF